MRLKLYSIFAFLLAFVIGALFNAPLAYAEIPSSITANFDVPLPSSVSSYYNQAVANFCSSENISDDIGNYYSFVIVYSDGNFNINLLKTSSDSPSCLFRRDPGIDSSYWLDCITTGFTDKLYVYYLDNGSLTHYVLNQSYFSIGRMGIGSSYYSNFTSITSSTYSFTINFIPDSWGENTPERYGSIESVSDAGVLAAMYDITFTPTKIMPSNFSSFPFLNKELEVAPTAVYDDTGYNLISLQVPQLGTYTDVVVYGKFTFTAKDVSKYSFDKLKISFGTDKIPTTGEDYTGDITNDDFSATFAGYELKEQSTTVNSLSFFYNTIIQNYSNVELASFDYSTNTSGSYPGGEFYAIGSINKQSAGAFCYNFSYTEINDVKNKRPLTPDEIDDLSDSGNDDSNRKKQKLGYVPRQFSANSVDVDFGNWQPKDYDFSAANGLLSILLNDFIIDILLACVSIGIVGLILYGKQ